MSVPAQLSLLNRNPKEHQDHLSKLIQERKKIISEGKPNSKNSLSLFSHKSQGFSHDDSFCATTRELEEGTILPCILGIDIYTLFLPWLHYQPQVNYSPESHTISYLSPGIKANIKSPLGFYY